MLSRDDTSAEPVPKLPTRLRGRNIFVFSGTGTQKGDPVEIEVKSQDGAGRIAGTYTLYSSAPGRTEVLCYEAYKVPLTGRYDGKSLTIRVEQSAKSKLCQDFIWMLPRGKDHFLEWVGRDGSSRLFLDSAE